MLDEAGFPDASIVLSNDLDELVIWQIITQIGEEAPRYGLDADHLLKRLVYGVGTRLITSWGEPALGGVYKLVAVCMRGSGGRRSRSPSRPIRRPIRATSASGASTTSAAKPPPTCSAWTTKIPGRQLSLSCATPDHTKYRVLDPQHLSEIEPLLVEVLREGKLVDELPSI